MYRQITKRIYKKEDRRDMMMAYNKLATNECIEMCLKEHVKKPAFLAGHIHVFKTSKLRHRKWL